MSSTLQLVNPEDVLRKTNNNSPPLSADQLLNYAFGFGLLGWIAFVLAIYWPRRSKRLRLRKRRRFGD